MFEGSCFLEMSCFIQQAVFKGLIFSGHCSQHQGCLLVSISHSDMSTSLRLHGLQPATLFCSWNSLGKNTGVGCSHSLLQGIFLTQGLSPDLLHYKQILNYLSHQGCPLGMLSITKVDQNPYTGKVSILASFTHRSKSETFWIIQNASQLCAN